MGIPISISETFYSHAKKIARAECRSIRHQIEYGQKLVNARAIILIYQSNL